MERDFVARRASVAASSKNVDGYQCGASADSLLKLERYRAEMLPVYRGKLGLFCLFSGEKRLGLWDGPRWQPHQRTCFLMERSTSWNKGENLLVKTAATTPERVLEPGNSEDTKVEGLESLEQA